MLEQEWMAEKLQIKRELAHLYSQNMHLRHQLATSQARNENLQKYLAEKVNELGGLEQKHESELLGKSNRLRIYFAEKAAEKVAEKEEAHVKDLAGLFEWNMKI